MFLVNEEKISITSLLSNLIINVNFSRHSKLLNFSSKFANSFNKIYSLIFILVTFHNYMDSSPKRFILQSLQNRRIGGVFPGLLYLPVSMGKLTSSLSLKELFTIINVSL